MVSWSALTRSIGVVLATALVVGLSVMPGSEAVAAPTPPVDALLDPQRDAPTLVAPDYEAPLPQFPDGEYVIAEPAGLVAEPIGREVGPREVTGEALTTEELEALPVVERDEFSTTYEASDETFLTVVSNQQVNIEDENGEFVEIERDARFDGERWVVEPHPLNPSFADSAAGEVARFSANGYNVSYSLVGANDSSIENPWLPWFQGPRAEVRYPGVFDNVDLVYSMSGDVTCTGFLGRFSSV